ncbi:pentapeptide repeat-containing protein, partial [Parafrankia soli]
MQDPERAYVSGSTRCQWGTGMYFSAKRDFQVTERRAEYLIAGRWLRVATGAAASGAALSTMGIFYLRASMHPSGLGGEAEARAMVECVLLIASVTLATLAGYQVAADGTRRAYAQAWTAGIREKDSNARFCARYFFGRAVDRLGSENNTTRLGGIYALERIAMDSPSDQRAVVEVLSAFIRTRSTDPTLRPAASGPVVPLRPAVDIHAAVAVLGRLSVLDGVPRADLSGANLTGPAALHCIQASYGNLSNTDLTGADLSHAHLGRADLTATRLGGTNLTGASLNEANLSYTWLGGANLTRARLGGADLTGASLSGANLTRAWLDGADLTGASLSGANLTRAWLTEADLTGAWLGGANLITAVGLVQDQIDAAYGDGWTRLPPELTRPASWTSAEADEYRPADPHQFVGQWHPEVLAGQDNALSA